MRLRLPSLRVELDPGDAAAYEEERIEINRRRVRGLASLLAVVHVAHVWHFHVPSAERALFDARVLQWRDALVVAHAATLPIALALVLLGTPGRARAVQAKLGPLAVFVYLAHAAAVAGIDQLVVANLTPYIAYAFATAVIFSLSPIESALVYGSGAVLLGVAASGPWASAAARNSNLPTLVTLTLVCIALAWFVDGARRRELSQRRTIARQRAELADLAAGLEVRVQAQVEEIVARAAEVDRLNAELREQVRARSTELSEALARLGLQMQRGHVLEPGSLIAGRFSVERRIGEGGMGSVYAGLDQSTGARVAIKVIHAASSVEREALQRFIREAGAAAAVSHPAVVRVLHVDVSEDGLLFQVQELVAGTTLGRRRHEPWAPGVVARLGAVLADALAAAHAVGVIHRDVKPENVLLTPTAPGLKLVDFGIAKLRGAVTEGEATRENVAVGTPGYMAPEQVTSNDTLTEAVDVYAVGVVAYELLAQRPPLRATSANSLMLLKCTRDADPLGPHAPDAPTDLVALVERCLARTPELRPSARALARELARIAERLGVHELALTDADGTEAATREEAVPVSAVASRGTVAKVV